MLRSESTKSTNMTDKQISEMETELEEYKELSTSRLLELEKFNVQYQASLKQIEKLKADVTKFPVLFYSTKQSSNIFLCNFE